VLALEIKLQQAATFELILPAILEGGESKLSSVTIGY
jgi:hypothetical protein